MFYLYQVDILFKSNNIYIFRYDQSYKYGENMYEFEEFSTLPSAPNYELHRKILHKNDFGRAFVETGNLVRVMLVSDTPLTDKKIVIKTHPILSTAFTDTRFSKTQRDKIINALKTAMNSVYGLTVTTRSK